ncbi:hypothetical protein ABZ372_52315, partial [Streptomyces sp. NPDC005921]
VKVVRAEHAEDRTFRARFRHEVRAAGTVGGTGPYTARVVDADTEADRPSRSSPTGSSWLRWRRCRRARTVGRPSRRSRS